MANKAHLKLLKQGVETWNQWRKQHSDIPDLSGTAFTQGNLDGINFREANLSLTVMRKFSLRYADFTRAAMSGADFSNADFTESNLGEATLIETDLSWCELANVLFIGTCLIGAKVYNANLVNANLDRARIGEADLSNANLMGATLRIADLRGADLRGVNLRNANLDRANLREANLWRANLQEANLFEANLWRANLHEANLRGIIMSGTTFANVDLRETKGVAEIKHLGPSPVALHSLQLPQDGSALHFLRGAGVPDEWIEDYNARMMYPIRYYSLFISFSSKDEMLAYRLHADFQGHGVRCWFAPEDMKIGDKIRTRIDEAIHLQDKLLLILSAASVTSDWVEHEVEMALAKERKEQRTVLFPIRIDRAILDQEDHGWPALVRHQRHIGDFTNWTDPQAYHQAFERLLRDLKKADEP